MTETLLSQVQNQNHHKISARLYYLFIWNWVWNRTATMFANVKEALSNDEKRPFYIQRDKRNSWILHLSFLVEVSKMWI